jgi:hypothetical protein
LIDPSKIGYGEAEKRFATPFADALATDKAFRKWVLERTEFADFAGEARLLHEEMKARRSGIAQTWWRSHFTEKCRCFGCSGKETDLLTIFENDRGTRFAVHFEVKQPADRFKDEDLQGARYPVRAACWAARPPRNVLPHQHATTALLFSEKNRERDAKHLLYFRTLITFESIRANFPQATPAD